MALVDNLKAARDNLGTQIADISANPKLDYSLDGQSVSWISYVESLTKRLEELNRLIIDLEPYSYRSVMR